MTRAQIMRLVFSQAPDRKPTPAEVMAAAVRARQAARLQRLAVRRVKRCARA